MPQPLSRVLPDVRHLEIGNVGPRTLARRPELAVLAMECIATWSHVESFMLNLFVELAGGDEADAAAIYVALESTTVKSKAVQVLAERKLDQDGMRLLNAIIRITKTAQKDRDKLAHWIWGSCEDENMILLADPKERGKLSLDKIYVYRANDFAAIRERFERIALLGATFRFTLNQGNPERNARLYARLSQEPEIAEILDRQARQA